MTSEEAAGPSNRRRRRNILDPVAGPSTEAPLTSPVKKRKPSTLSVGEQQIIINAYFVKNTWPEDEYHYSGKIIDKVAEITGVSQSSVSRILRTYRDKHTIEEKGFMKNKKTTILEKLNEFEKSAIRRKVHQLFLEGELPTLKKILTLVNEDDQLPHFSKTTLHRVLLNLKFKYVKRSRQSALIDRPEIVLWRTKYLGEIARLRNEGRRIFYLDETWVNAGHTVGKVWEDCTVKSSRQAFLEGLSTGAKNPTGKGKRLIVVHIGNEDGFLGDCDWIFESSATGDYHESMDAPHFEEWFQKVLNNLQSGDIVVMDNATYHSRRLEKIPTMSWKKQNIQEWLDSKEIAYAPTETKTHLMEKIKPLKQTYQKYDTDEMAKEKGITVVRLPPYHCELNPIELVWADIKGYVARNNTTFKLKDVKKLLMDGINQITPEKWKNCVKHVMEVETKMRGLDNLVDRTIDRFVISVTDSSTESSSESENSSDST